MGSEAPAEFVCHWRASREYWCHHRVKRRLPSRVRATIEAKERLGATPVQACTDVTRAVVFHQHAARLHRRLTTLAEARRQPFAPFVAPGLWRRAGERDGHDGPTTSSSWVVNSTALQELLSVGEGGT